jgi:hypothetical protein
MLSLSLGLVKIVKTASATIIQEYKLRKRRSPFSTEAMIK